MKKEMDTVKELQCEIVQDLLPLYHDDVVNAVTKEAVEQHLETCADCTREYEELCAELPQEKTDKTITKSKFNIMKHHIKKKQNIQTFFVALLSCALVVLVGYVLLYIPIVPIKDSEAMEIQAAYKIEKKDKTFLFFVFKQYKAYSGPMQWKMQIEKDGGNTVLSANMKRTVLTSVEGIGSTDIDWIEIDQDTETISFAGKTIWSKEENGKEDIPEYVKEIIYLDDSSQEYGIGIDDEEITIQYDNIGKYITWNFNGNEICEGYYEYAPSKYFEGSIIETNADYMIIEPQIKYWIRNISDKIYVSKKTEDGTTADDFKNVKTGDLIGVLFSGDMPAKPDYTIDEVIRIETIPNEK
ncbi:MAG: zf-HC2 domain-containing protein [Lachnospiraceae bacterium]|nr:zf-HC2 domain-containing protein [Lachnospiraceae bacterium]